MRLTCPKCKTQLSWRDRLRLSRFFGFRKISRCKRCGVSLIWSKWPWVSIKIGSYICIVALASMLLSVGDESKVFSILIKIAVVLCLIGSFTLRCEIYDQKPK